MIDKSYHTAKYDTFICDVLQNNLSQVSPPYLTTGTTAIITGGGRAVLSDGSCGSIGYGIATAYAKEGANLVLTGRNVKKLEDAKEELERLYGIKVLPVQADVSAGADNEAIVQNVVKQAIDTFGRIEIGRAHV